jgi:hypothetical protein
LASSPNGQRLCQKLLPLIKRRDRHVKDQLRELVMKDMANTLNEEGKVASAAPAPEHAQQVHPTAAHVLL